MMKLRMKISDTSRTLEGAQVFADIRSVISTPKKARAQNPRNPDPVTNSDHCTPLMAGTLSTSLSR